jgi:hypothetical protein
VEVGEIKMTDDDTSDLVGKESLPNEEENTLLDSGDSESVERPTEEDEEFLKQNLKGVYENKQQGIGQQQQQGVAFTQKDLYNQLSSDVKQVLDRCTGWAITRVHSPQKFIIATKDSNQILRAQIQKEEHKIKVNGSTMMMMVKEKQVLSLDSGLRTF